MIVIPITRTEMCNFIREHDRQRIKALGNSIVPQCAAVIGTYIADELLVKAGP